MADGYGADPLMKSMFWHEAMAGPTERDLASMNSPFGGNPQQAASFLQSPQMQQELGRYGIHFDPSQIRQSPFFPQGFMQQHPHMGGALTGAFANAASTPEAPMVSGAGSGISRAAQGAFGGPEMLRQYQVRQMMAPMAALGMQLPIRAEERRQQLLQDLEQDMMRREQFEQQRAERQDRIGADVLVPPGAGGYLTRERPQQIQNMPMPGGGGPGQAMQHPAMPFPGVPGGFPQSQGMGMSPGGFMFHPFDPMQAQAYQQAVNPQKFAGAELSKTKAAEQAQETASGMPGARVEDVKAQASQRRQTGAAATTRAGKMASPIEREARELAKSDRWFGSQLQGINDHFDKYIVGAEKPEQRAAFQAQKEQAIQQLTNNYNQAAQRSQHSPTDQPLGPANPNVPPPPPPQSNKKASQKPQGTAGRGAQAGGAGANIPGTTAVSPEQQYNNPNWQPK